MRTVNTLILLSVMCLSLNGCLVAGIGAGVGAWKYGNAEKTKAQTTCKNAYNDYLDNINGTSTNILTLDEYCTTK